jgi:O-antigen ligase
LAWIIYLVRRHRYLILAILLLIALILPLEARRQMARLDPNIPRYASVLHRLELYNFALHIWKIHPVMGIGLRSLRHDQYVKDYQSHNQALHKFPQTVATLQTFDDMLLTGVVELGSLMTLLYLGLLLAIVVRYCRTLGSSLESSALGWYRVIVLLGFAIHSLSYDSLLVPPVNWLFHVQVGIMAGYQASETAPG